MLTCLAAAAAEAGLACGSRLARWGYGREREVTLLAGHGHRVIGAGLGVPDATVRGWLRRLRSRAGDLRCHALGQLAVFGGDRIDGMAPSGSPLGDALAALTAVVRAVQRRLPGYGGPGLIWPLLGQLGLAAHLTPARGG